MDRTLFDRPEIHLLERSLSRFVYHKNDLIGDWIGREGMGFEGWSTDWFSPRDSLQFRYRNAKVAGDFIPGGETVERWLAKAGLVVLPRF